MTLLQKIVGLVLLLVMSLLLMADTLITSSIIPQLQAEFAVSKIMIGVMGSAFVLVGAVVGLYSGYLTDRYNRKYLMVGAVILGELPCIATGIHVLTPNFATLLFWRLLTGFGIGAVYPITMSLLSDFFPPQHRAKANALAELSWIFGTLLGPILGGLAIETDYGWRLAFLMAGVPNVILALIFLLGFREPLREGSLEGDVETRASGETYRAGVEAVLSKRSNLFLFLQSIPGSIPWGLLPFWLITYFVTERSLTQAQATGIWESFSIVALVGILSWSVLGDILHRRYQRGALYTVCVASFTGIVSFGVLINLNLGFSLLIVLIPLTALGIGAPATNVRSWLMNSNDPERRGSVFALFFLSDSVGKGLGPAIGGMIAALLGSLHMAVNAAVGIWLLHVLLMALGARYYQPLQTVREAA